jgi:peptidoglycan hydrolase-like protein with peptidoglycan-binding domain
MTLFYPDVSAYEAGIAISGPAVCIKATEGTGWVNSDYSPALTRAHAAGTFAFAYHFLHAGNTSSQAGFCHQVAGSTGLMLDVEPTGSSSPSVADATAFLDAYKAAGGICNLTYFPAWYWVQLGRPSLQPLIDRGQHLVSSNYTSYTDNSNGAGWAPYGGMTPAIWQFTSTCSWNGYQCDCNAYRGTLAQLQAMVGGQAPPPPPPSNGPAFPYGTGHYLGQPSASPYCHSGYYGGPDQINVHTWQAQMAHRGWTITQDGRFGAESAAVTRSFQAEKELQVDGKVGPVTWGASWSAPVT